MPREVSWETASHPATEMFELDPPGQRTCLLIFFPLHLCWKKFHWSQKASETLKLLNSRLIFFAIILPSTLLFHLPPRARAGVSRFQQHLPKSSPSAISLAVSGDLIPSLTSLASLLSIRTVELKGKLLAPSPELRSRKQHLEERILPREQRMKDPVMPWLDSLGKHYRSVLLSEIYNARRLFKTRPWSRWEIYWTLLTL